QDGPGLFRFARLNECLSKHFHRASYLSTGSAETAAGVPTGPLATKAAIQCILLYRFCRSPGGRLRLRSRSNRRSAARPLALIDVVMPEQHDRARDEDRRVRYHNNSANQSKRESV